MQDRQVAAHPLQEAAGIARLAQLREKFTAPAAFLPEMLRQARRCGAGALAFEWEPEVRLLTLRYQGAALPDVQRLKDLAHGDWRVETLAAIHPFAGSLLTALAVCEEVTLSHDSKCLRLQAAHFFASGHSDVFRRANLNGDTQLRVRLSAVHAAQASPYSRNRALSLLVAAAWREHLSALLQGFPNEVSFNGAPLPRPFAGGEWRQTPVGRARLAAAGKPHLFYEGVLLELGDGGALHLDEQIFKLEAGEHQRLVNHNAGLSAIAQSLQSVPRV